MRLTELAHAYWGQWIRTGDAVLDATAGNGHDTLVLAQLAGTSGRVFAVDIQKTAVDMTAHRLATAGLTERVTLQTADHSRPDTFLPETMKRIIRLAVFNLGYLPGGDHHVTTVAETSLSALQAIEPWLADAAMLSIMTYPGHPEGLREHRMLQKWLRSPGLSFPYRWRHGVETDDTRKSPVLHLLIRH